jgi:catechol 2,3-dioxygenase-like lactoylglutathione lyase family enzyme
MWSISESKTFQRCQRQWFYKNILGCATAKDDLRQRAYRLSKLESISAWRGNIVDDTISKFVIPGVRNGRPPSLEVAKRHALAAFDAQLTFGRAHRLWEDVSPAKAGADFAAFHAMEYDGQLAEDEIVVARNEVLLALTNLYGMQEIKSRMKAAQYLVPQRPLMFHHTDATVRAVPDLIAFYQDAPPLIFDWKVHVFGLQEAWLQLAVYALALLRAKPHKDFPATLQQLRETDVRLLEIQLLKNEVREYSLDDDDVERAEGYVAESIMNISMATRGLKHPDLTAEDFLVTQYPEVCTRCSFRSLCWE